MDVSAAITSKGQLTVPKEVREALSLREGDRVLFRVRDGVAVLARTADLLELAGTIPVPAGAESLGQNAERRRAHDAQARRSR